MYAVGRIGSYISRGVYTVSAPFHPFGGAVDIIVVQQQDGSFKSSPWYVRFGKFQGVLKSKEKVVNISVNGVDADFHMYLDNKGEAYFLREADVEEGDPVCCISSSGEEADEKPYNRRHVKSKSCDYDFDQANSVTEISLSDGKILARTNSRKSRILGFMFGRKSMKRDGFPKEVDSRGVCRTESLERAEIAADLLEVKWSTNSPSNGCHKDVDPTSSVLPVSDGNADKGLQIDDQENKVEPVETNSENVRSHEEERLQVLEKMYSSNSTSPGTESFHVESGVEMSCSVAEYVVDETGLGESYLVDNKEVHAEMSSDIHEFSTAETDQGAYRMEFTTETPDADYQILDDAKVEAEVSSKEKLEKEKVVDGKDDCSPDGGGAFGEYNGAIEAHSSVYCGTSESSIVELESNGEQAKESLDIPYGCGEVCAEAETLNEMTGLISEVSCQPEAILLVAKEYFGIEGGYRDDNCCKPLNDATVLENEEISPCSLSNNTVAETYSQILTIHRVNDSEEEQLPFGELDDFKSGGVACIDSNLPDPAANEIHLSFISRTIETSDKPVSSLPEANSSPKKFIQKNLPNDEDLRIRPKRVSSEIDIPTSSKVVGEEDGRIVKSMPSFWSHNKNACDLSESSEVLAQNESFQEQAASTNTISEDLKTVPSTFAGDPSKVNDASGGSWRIWSFPFKKSQSMKEIQSDLNNKRNPEAENYSKSSSGMDGGKDGSKPKVSVKEIRVLTPTTEQLASLNLKEGRNEVVFAFSTAMLGNQQVDARIYLWRWDTRIVISDVDGTITKSDVLGQFMPLVGRDWSQTGVTHFFSAIKENGYQFLFLSARSISQAYRTRQFLFNLKQDGKALPDGPVVISPDGLFPSLFREVFSRAPHEFKIACLEEIKALFASDRNPYYAGFGNRDTDEISYLKVGIPKGKIFIINPKGEVSAHRRVDTKSYTSLNTLVNGMFPSISSYEQEDFNSWNYWRLPSPSIDIRQSSSKSQPEMVIKTDW